MSLTHTSEFMGRMITLTGLAADIALMLAIPFMTNNGSIYQSEDRVDPVSGDILYYKGDLFELCHAFVDRPMVSHHTWIFCVQLLVIMHFMALSLMADSNNSKIKGYPICVMGWITQLAGSFAILVMARYDYEVQLHFASIAVFSISSFLYHLLMLQCVGGYDNKYRWGFISFQSTLLVIWLTVVAIRLIQPHIVPNHRYLTVYSWIITYLILFMEFAHCSWLIALLWW